MFSAHMHRGHIAIAHAKGMTDDFVLIPDQALLTEKIVEVIGVSSGLNELRALFVLLFECCEIFLQPSCKEHFWQSLCHIIPQVGEHATGPQISKFTEELLPQGRNVIGVTQSARGKAMYRKVQAEDAPAP